MVQVDWKGDMVFEATPPSGRVLVFDAYPEDGLETRGPTPIEAFLSSLAACTAMDVISILKKKRQEVASYRVEIEGDREPPGTWPRPFRSITVRHIVSGPNLDPVAVSRAVELSDEKYCSVSATLREGPQIQTEWRVETPESAGAT
jgi:putative redox protein